MIEKMVKKISKRFMFCQVLALYSRYPIKPPVSCSGSNNVASGCSWFSVTSFSHIPQTLHHGSPKQTRSSQNSSGTLVIFSASWNLMAILHSSVVTNGVKRFSDPPALSTWDTTLYHPTSLDATSQSRRDTKSLKSHGL